MTYRLRLLIQIASIFLGVVAIMRASAQHLTNTMEPQAEVILGVLEDFPGRHAYDPDFRAVRATFKKNGDDWQAFPDQNKQLSRPGDSPTSYPKEHDMEHRI